MERKNRIYLDHAATTPLGSPARSAMEECLGASFGNPGSLHFFGQEAISRLDASRETIASFLDVPFRNILFAGSATEANNLVLRGAVKAFQKKFPLQKARIVVSAIEHESIAYTARDLETESVALTVIHCDSFGFTRADDVKEALGDDVAVVCVMLANNEVGSIQPIPQIAQAIKEFRGKNTYPLLHSDASQAGAFFNCSPHALGADIVTVSPHKMYGPKGVGILAFAKDKSPSDIISPLITGGGQEYGLRSGTENILAIVGACAALSHASQMREEWRENVASLRHFALHLLRDSLPGAFFHGAAEGDPSRPMAAHIINLRIPNKRSQDVLTRLDLAGIAASSGSACKARAMAQSPTLIAMGIPPEETLCALRLSLGVGTTREDIQKTANELARICSF